MNAYKTQRTWAVPFLAALSLFVLNFSEMLAQQDPMSFLQFMHYFGFRPELILDTWLAAEYKALALVSLTGVLHQFMHSDLTHFSSNIVMLFVFGMRVERYLGWWRFVVLYLAGGFAAAFGFWAMTGDGITPLVGASGSVAAVSGAYLAHVLHVRGTSRFETVVGVLVSLLAVTAVSLDVAAIAGYFGPSDGLMGVAHQAHIAGFVFGYLVMLVSSIVRKRRNRIRISPPVAAEV